MAEQEVNLVHTLGIEVVRLSADEVIAEMNIENIHLQGFGVVHGGVYCCLIETAASRGAAEAAKLRGQPPPFGVENSTSFLRSARSGRIRVNAKPISSGRTTQVWEAAVRDSEDRLLAVGRVRLISPSDPSTAK